MADRPDPADAAAAAPAADAAAAAAPVDAAAAPVDAADAAEDDEAADTALGDSPWLLHFVRSISSDAVRFPDAAERARRDAAHLAVQRATAAHWAALTPEEQAAEHAAAHAHAAALVAELVRRVPEQLDALADAVPQAKAPAPRRLLPLVAADTVMRARDTAPGCAAQLRVHQQVKNPSCGYFSLFNGLTCARALLYVEGKPAPDCLVVAVAVVIVVAVVAVETTQ